MKKHKLSRREFLRGASLTGVSLLLAACSQPGPLVVVQQEQAAGAAPPAPETVELLMWYQAQNHQPEYDGRLAEFEEKFNIKLTYENLSRDAMTKKLPTTLMAGTGFPDIIEQNADDIVKFMKGSDAEIPMVALNEVLANSPYADAVLESRWARYTKDGNIYGAPHDVHPIVMLYNDTLWQKSGVNMEDVNTWDDFLAACQAFGTESTLPDGVNQFAILDGLSATNLPTRMLQNGVWWTGEDGEPMLTAPGFREAVVDWMRFADYRVDIDWGNPSAQVKSGMVLTQLIPDWFFGIHKQANADDADYLADSPMRIKMVPNGPATGSWGGTACSVLKQSEHIALAIDIMLYIYFENGEGQLDTRWLETGILPPVPSAWESDAYKQEDAYVGGQVSGQIFVEAAKALPPYFENWTTNLVVSAWGEQFSLAWEGEISVDEAIKLADENARAEIEKNI